MDYLLLGIINDAFSLDGTLKVKSTTSFANKRYQKGNIIYLYNPNDKSYSPLTVESYRRQGLFDFVKVEEINSVEEALKLKGYELNALKDSSILKKGEYYYVDLVGCKIFDESNNLLGEVSNVEEYPSTITLRIKRKNNKDFFVPFVNEFIKKVDIVKKEIIIKVIEGML